MAVKESTTTRELDGGPAVMGLRDGLADRQTRTWVPAALAGIDELNQRIVSMLQEDGRASFATIARTLGVSEGTVRARVAQLRKANLIHFVAVVNPLALGYSAWAMIGLRVAPGTSPDKVACYYRERPEVVYVMRVAARFDLLVEVICSNPTELRDFLDAHCYGSPDVVSVEPMMGLGLYKSLLKWEKPLRLGESEPGKNGGQGA
ncbi:MAG TPA: Lrp/AsnC family transcriptional regulator [Alphaproteobacteria bacterium]|nr:Lrp/AsnC family transcriptional regulator [Alphaproteobacteria bacterium]